MLGLWLVTQRTFQTSRLVFFFVSSLQFLVCEMSHMNKKIISLIALIDTKRIDKCWEIDATRRDVTPTRLTSCSHVLLAFFPISLNTTLCLVLLPQHVSQLAWTRRTLAIAKRSRFRTPWKHVAFIIWVHKNIKFQGMFMSFTWGLL